MRGREMRTKVLKSPFKMDLEGRLNHLLIKVALSWPTVYRQIDRNASSGELAYKDLSPGFLLRQQT